MEKRKERKQRQKKDAAVRLVLTLIFAAIFIYGAVNLFGIWQEYHESEVLYDNAQEEFLQPVEEQTDKLADAKLHFAVDFDSIQAINPDVTGWIWMEDTVVNYPVLHSKKDNDEYLYTTYDGKQNSSGSIFVDYRNNAGYTDDNTVLYGHNMKNGSMFAVLKKLAGQEFYDAHKTFYILTPEGNRRYEIISVFQVDALSSLYDRQFDTIEDKQDWLNRVLQKSAILSPFTASVEDTFVMLSTCVSGDDLRARIVAVGRLAEIEALYQPAQTPIAAQ